MSRLAASNWLRDQGVSVLDTGVDPMVGPRREATDAIVAAVQGQPRWPAASRARAGAVAWRHPKTG